VSSYSDISMEQITTAIGTLTTLVGVVIALGVTMFGANTGLSQAQSIRKRR
jgi:hypothetical protein